ncbi:hypothetical protein [Streptomyces sp. NBC_00046]|uniref:hypothetical protein n=1 Tax=unclassified Streptomyces TaxID=2593676 RepID=UPI003245B9DB
MPGRPATSRAWTTPGRTSSSTWDPRFNIAASGPAQGLRPLRDPDEADPADEDQDEG